MPPRSPPRSRDDFRTAIVCALPLEAGFVEMVLDVCWEDKGQRYGKAVGDQNAYTTGAIGGYNVVLAYMPSMGITSAAAVAVGLRSSFHNIELALLVGICGVVPVHPTTKEEIVLGDCIISTAIVQYDFGRQYPGGFVRKHSINTSLGRTGSMIQAMISKCTAPLGRQRLTKRLRHHLVSLQSQAPAAKYLGAAQDRLYESSYVHKHRGSLELCDKCLPEIGTCSRDCSKLGCDPGRLVSRERLKVGDAIDFNDDPRDCPRVYLGRFGSANTVMKSGEDRDRLATADDLVAFEMEGVGVRDHLPTIVIKAACDYADSHKNSEWQDYAAAAAAACMKAFLEDWEIADPPSSHGGPSAHPLHTNNDQQAPDCSTQHVWHVPFIHKQGFVGRSDELKRLTQQLMQPGGARPMSIVGLGGMGKSRLARELAHHVQVERLPYSVFWVQATDASTFIKDVRDIGMKLSIPGIEDGRADVMALVRQRLSDPARGRWLLILDNVDDEVVWAKQSSSSQHLSLAQDLSRIVHGFLVVTTRSRRVAVHWSGSAIIDLQAPSSDEAYQMLINEHVEGGMISDQSLARALLEKLSYLPLAIVQAASFLDMTQESIHTYLELLDQSEAEVIELLSQDFGDSSRYPSAKNPVAETWLISFDYIHQHEPLAATYLSTMACLHNKNIPHTLLPEAPSKIDAVRAVATLTGYSFVTKQTRQDAYNEVGDLYDIHRLVHLATRNWLKLRGLFGDHVERAVARLARLFPTSDHRYRAMWTAYTPHGEKLCLERSALSSHERHNLLQSIGACLVADGKYAKAVAAYAEVVKWRETILGINDKEMLTAYIGLGQALCKQGDFELAEEYILRALHGCENWYGEEGLLTVKSQAALALTYKARCQFQEAERLQLQVLETRTRVLGPEHPDTLWSQSELAITYRDQGRVQKAERLYVQVLEMQTRVLGPEHPYTLQNQASLAITYQIQGRVQEAERLHAQALEMQTRVLGPEHPYTLQSQANLALTYRSQGRVQEAERLQAWVLEMQAQVLGLEHPNTLWSQANLASTYRVQGRLQEAERLQVQVLEIQTRVFGPKYHGTLRSQSELAATYWSQGRVQEAARLQVWVLEISTRVLGSKHPSTLGSKDRVAKYCSIYSSGREI